MEFIKKFMPLAWPLILLVLTVVAGYAYSQIRALSLPISQALALFTIVLPLVTGISTQGVRGLLQRRNSNEQNELTLPLIAVIGFQLIYETVVATLALTHMIPPESLRCGLDDKWQKMYHDKNARQIRGIQDGLNCCGYKSVVDRAWPFLPSAKDPGNCAEITDRSQSCFGVWRQAEQINAGLLLLVAIIVFIVKVSVFTIGHTGGYVSSWFPHVNEAPAFVVLTSRSFMNARLITGRQHSSNSSWKRSGWYRPIGQIIDRDSPEPEEDDDRAVVRGRIEEADGEDIESQPYRDDEPSNNAWDGPRVEPSPLSNIR
ncbi:tetraspanin Tsp3 protein [Rutstroemia sp. NJR-2017a WRK4]|nr:tetraspanin Tsp3 protein [Rutstroemia sp. NJR-2017a WRK4]